MVRGRNCWRSRGKKKESSSVVNNSDGVTATHIPWYDYMKVGMGPMKLSPRDFWELTPNEFWAIYHALFDKPKTGMSRTEFSDLMRKVPD